MLANELYTSKTHKKYSDLHILKYKKKVFFDNLWNESPELLECRGRVVNDFGETIVNPFTKIFNYRENGTVIDADEICLAVQKINGFMACVTYVPDYDDVLVTTTGSFDSEYVNLAKQYIPEAFINYVKENKSQYTFIFEIVAKEDKIVHPIKEKYGAYLLGMRKIDSENHYFSTGGTEVYLDLFVKRINKTIKDNKKILRPDYLFSKFDKIVEEAKVNKHIEGYVVYGTESNTVLKIKTSYYLTKKAIMRKKDIFSLDKKKVDEEYYPLLEYCKGIEGFSDLSEESRVKVIEDYFERN